MAEERDVTFLNSTSMLNFYWVLDDLRAGMVEKDHKKALKLLAMAASSMVLAGKNVHRAGRALGKVDCETLSELRTWNGLGTNLSHNCVYWAEKLSKANSETRKHFEDTGRDLDDPHVYEMYKGLARLVSLTVHAYAGNIVGFGYGLAEDIRDRTIRNVAEFGCYTELKPVPVSEQKTWYYRKWPARGRNAP